MCKKLLFPVIAVSLLALARSANAQCSVDEGETFTVTTSETCGKMSIAGTLIIESTGSITGGDRSTLDGSGAQIVVNGGSFFIDGRFNVGQGSDGYITMNGGTFTVTGTFKFPDDPGGVHRIYLNDGIMHSGDIQLISERDAVIYVGDGILRLDEVEPGDDEYDPSEWIEQGALLPAEGYDEIVIEYIAAEDYTEVRAIKPDPNLASNPSPAHNEFVVPVDEQLSWTPGEHAVLHDVYLGTSFDDVNEAGNPDVLPGRGRQEPNSYDPCGLEYYTTYYWRIDEVNGPNTWKGKVWHFKTRPEVFDPHLLLWYRFDETEGDTAADSSGRDHNGEVDRDGGGNWDIDGYFDGCLAFDDDTAVLVPKAALSNIDEGITVALWLNGGDSTGRDNWVFDTGSGDSFIRAIVPTYMGEDVYFRAGGEINDELIWYESEPQDWRGSWSHYAFVKDENQGKMWIYLNGRPVAEKTGTSTDTLADVRNTTFKIGAMVDHQNDYIGSMDDFRVYDYAMSATEVANLFRQGGDLGQAWSPHPYDGAQNMRPTVSISWSPGDYAVLHNVYFGTDFNDVNDANTTVTLGVYEGSQDYEANSYVPSAPLEFGQTYFWRIDEVNSVHPNSPWKGQIWCFTVDSGKARNPNPQDGAWSVPEDAYLSWTPGLFATSHDVYFGTDFDDVNDAANPNELPGRGRQMTTIYDPCGLLEAGVTYYWRIDEVNGPNVWRGDVWSFTVVQLYVNSLGMVFIRMPARSFMMGSEDGEWDERPVHNVTISQQFYIQAIEVTADQYWSFDPTYWGPWFVAGISWYDANAFAEWLSQEEGLPYRLPTEAEWEYVCRAGITTPYSSGNSPPPFGTPNPWGVINMHNSPREWVLNWHGEYSYEDQVDPVGPEYGIARVVRGGGLDNDDPYFMRSSNRAGIAPGFGGGFHDIGFRLVLGDLPATAPEPYQAPFVRQGIKENTGQVLQGPDPSAPYFNQRSLLPIPPDNSSRAEIDAAGLHPSFRGHNHSPGLEVCPNGDVLMIIYTSYDEYEEGVSLMATRLRFGADQWDMPSPMFDFPGINDHAPMLWNDNGTLHLFWGCPELDGAYLYPFQWISSQDSGAIWDEVKFPVFESWMGGHSRQPINTALRVGDTMYVSSDGSGGSSVLWRSDNNGLTWYDPGGRTYGRHTTFVLLNNGDILGMGGKNTDIGGYMPKSISSDGGQSWSLSSTPFSWLGSNQRPCIARLASGKLFFCSDFQHSFDCDQPPGITDFGALASLSDDEGQTWHIKRIPTALPHECACWWCGAGTLGYSVARQAPNGIIHVISTMNHPCQHFEMNEAWILDLGTGGDPPPDPGESGTVNQYQENYPGGATKATWSAKTCDDGRYLLHGAETWYYQDGQKQYEVTHYNGRKVGDETYWDPNGIKQWSWDHNEADNTHLWTQWWPNGFKHIESNWRSGSVVAHGKAYHWYQDGTPQAAWNFVDGVLTGPAPLPNPQYPPLEVAMKFTPQALNPCSEGRWVKPHLTLPEGFMVEDVDTNTPATLTLLGIEVESRRIHVISNGKGSVKLVIDFDRASLCGVATDTDSAEVTITGSLVSGQHFVGKDTIKLRIKNDE